MTPKDQVDEEEWKPIGGKLAPIFDLTDDDLVARYYGSRDVETKDGKRTIHDFSTEDGDWALWGAAILDRLLEGHEQHVVRVRLTGDTIRTKANREAKEYLMWCKDCAS